MTGLTNTLIFIHIPKTAGSTLNSVLNRQYEPTSTYKIYGSDKEGKELVDELARLPAEEKKQLDLIRGHWPYGLHHYLPQRSTYISFIRHPVERIISFYYHILRTPEHYVYRQGFSAEIDLLTFVEQGFAENEVQNGQAYFLTGKRDECQQLPAIIDHIESCYALVGISEYFDQSLILMKRLLGWKKPFYYPRRVNKLRPYKGDIPPQIITAIEERNSLDVKLYGHFSRVLQQQVEAQGPSFQREVRAFRLLNRIYKTYKRTRLQADCWKGNCCSEKSTRSHTRGVARATNRQRKMALERSSAAGLNSSKR